MAGQSELKQAAWALSGSTFDLNSSASLPASEHKRRKSTGKGINQQHQSLGMAPTSLFTDKHRSFWHLHETATAHKILLPVAGLRVAKGVPNIDVVPAATARLPGEVMTVH